MDYSQTRKTNSRLNESAKGKGPLRSHIKVMRPSMGKEVIMDYCKVIMHGRLTQDPELRYAQSGTAMASFSLAINRKFRKGDSGEFTEAVTFIPIRAYGKAAEHAGQYLGKGRAVLVDGELRSSEWTDKASGQGRYMLYVAAQKIIYLGKANGQPVAPEEPAEATDADVPF
jgi:single stranded DNA-binding protein